MSQTDKTIEEAVGSFNGYDEIAVEKHFGHDLAGLQERGTTLLRAAVFVLKRREGLSDSDAKTYAMELELEALQTYFADEDVDPDDPDTPAGKGDSPHAGEPVSSPSSAPTPESNPLSFPA